MDKLRGLCFVFFFLGGSVIGAIIILVRRCDSREALDIFKKISLKALSTLNINVELDGEENLSISDGFVAVHNETSWPDLIALQAALYNDYVDHSAVAKEYSLIPFMKQAFKVAGIVFVPRGDRAGIDLILHDLTNSLKSGKRVIWGGEGRLSGIDGVLRFKVGSALLAIRSQKPLIPIAFHGGQKLMPLKSIALKSGTIRIRVGTPISTKGLTEDNLRELADKAQLAVSVLYEELSTLSN
jgi:1-acyl-sn-glycerol-3-phosphate acyltransferase